MRRTRKAGRKLVNDFGKHQLCDLTPKVLKTWLTRLPVAATTKNNIRVNLSEIFKQSKDQEWVESNRIAEVDTFGDRRIKAKPPRIVTVKEAAALLESACDEILLYFAIGLFAGLGVAEIERLDWSEVDFDKSEIHVIPVKAKTAQYRTLPMTENLVAWLAPYRQSQGRVAPHCDEPRRQT